MDEENIEMKGLVIIGTTHQLRHHADTKMVSMDYLSVTGIRNARIPSAAIVRQENLSQGRVALLIESTGGFDPAIYFGNALAPEFPTTELMGIAMAMEAGEELEENAFEDDDEAPNFDKVEQTIEVSVGTTFNIPPADPEDTMSDDNVPWYDSLRAGGRGSKIVDWDFTPVRKPAFVFLNEGGDGMGPTAAPVNGPDGKPAAYHLFNPDLADAKRPMGAHLGTFSESYYAMPYSKGVEHFIQKSNESGWRQTVTAYNEGGRMRMDCDVSQAGHTLEETRNKMLAAGHRYLDNGMMEDISADFSNLYRFGFTIHNSLDGNSAYRIQATAMNMLCANLMTMGKSANILSFKHGKALKEADFKTIADQVDKVLVEAQTQLLNVEMMKRIPTTDKMLEQIMTLSEKHGLIRRPKVTKDEAGEVTGVSSGYMWRLMGQGWTNPREEWVGVKEEDEGTLFHAYNLLTGALTWRPTFHQGSAKMEGHALNLNTLNQRLGKTHEMFTALANSAMSAFTKDKGSKIEAADNEAIGEYISEHGIPQLVGVAQYSDVMFS